MNNPVAARILSLLRRLGSTLRIAVARSTGAEIGRNCVIAAGTDLHLGLVAPRVGRLLLGDQCELSQNVVLHPYGGSIRLGRDVFLGPGVVIYGHGGVEIGDGCLIAMHCRILSSNHEIPPLGVAIRSRPDRLAPTRIGRDVWLGAGATVLAGVAIGDGCVVAAGAVVTRDLPPGTIAQGVPARPVRTRAP